MEVLLPVAMDAIAGAMMVVVVVVAPPPPPPPAIASGVNGKAGIMPETEEKLLAVEKDEEVGEASEPFSSKKNDTLPSCTVSRAVSMALMVKSSKLETEPLPLWG